MCVNYHRYTECIATCETRFTSGQEAHAIKWENVRTSNAFCPTFFKICNHFRVSITRNCLLCLCGSCSSKWLPALFHVGIFEDRQILRRAPKHQIGCDFETLSDRRSHVRANFPRRISASCSAVTMYVLRYVLYKLQITHFLVEIGIFKISRDRRYIGIHVL